MATLASPGAEEDIEDAPDVVKSKPQALRVERGGETEPQQPSSPNGEVPGGALMESVSLSEPQRRSNSDSDGSGSQTVLLRSVGRAPTSGTVPESLRLGSRVDFTQTDTFRVGGRTCTVTLEEDRITWAPKKTSGMMLSTTRSSWSSCS